MFEILGYFEEYYIGNKFIGTRPTEKQDRKIGYSGQISYIADKDIVFENKKRIKKDTNYRTLYYPLNKYTI